MFLLCLSILMSKKMNALLCLLQIPLEKTSAGIKSNVMKDYIQYINSRSGILGCTFSAEASK